MTRTSFAHWPCSVARAVDVLGDAWSLLILREAYAGVRRFDGFQRGLNISRNILTKRLQALCEHGLFEQVQYQDNPPRYEYVLTEMGQDFFPVVAALVVWGDRWLATEDGPPIQFFDREDGHLMRPVVVDEHNHKPIAFNNTQPMLGPGHPRYTPPDGAEEP